MRIIEMKTDRLKFFVLAILSVLLLIGCSQGGGTGGTGFVAQGPVSAFGSIVFNGTVSDIINAVISYFTCQRANFIKISIILIGSS